MIKLGDERLHRRADNGVIVNPASPATDFTFDRDFDFEAVPMHFATLMSLGRGGQSLSGFEGEIFRETGAHRDGKSHRSTPLSPILVLAVARTRRLDNFLANGVARYRNTPHTQ